MLISYSLIPPAPFRLGRGILAREVREISISA
jgi:hypothetical protein